MQGLAKKMGWNAKKVTAAVTCLNADVDLTDKEAADIEKLLRPAAPNLNWEWDSQTTWAHLKGKIRVLKGYLRGSVKDRLGNDCPIEEILKAEDKAVAIMTVAWFCEKEKPHPFASWYSTGGRHIRTMFTILWSM